MTYLIDMSFYLLGFSSDPTKNVVIQLSWKFLKYLTNLSYAI